MNCGNLMINLFGEIEFDWQIFLECSRAKDANEESKFHCQPNGNFEPVQCNGGICWCADEKTGQVLAGTRAVPEHLWAYLPCCKSEFSIHSKDVPLTAKYDLLITFFMRKTSSFLAVLFNIQR